MSLLFSYFFKFPLSIDVLEGRSFAVIKLFVVAFESLITSQKWQFSYYTFNFAHLYRHLLPVTVRYFWVIIDSSCSALKLKIMI